MDLTQKQKEIGCKPMNTSSIRAAIQPQRFDRIIFSSVNSEIAEVAKGYPADSRFLRSAKLSDDHASTISVMSHAI